MRPLVRLAAALLLGAFISFGTTCGELRLGGPYHPLATDARPAASTSSILRPSGPSGRFDERVVALADPVPSCITDAAPGPDRRGGSIFDLLPEMERQL